MSSPYPGIKGDTCQPGFARGKRLRERITHNLEIYFKRFKVEGLGKEAVLQRAERYLTALAGQSPAYLAGMRGIAEGGGFELPAIGALNVHYEILYHPFAYPVRVVDECAAFALLPAESADGSLWMEQGWDWFPEIPRSCVAPPGTRR